MSIQLRAHLTQTRCGSFRGDIALRIAEHFVADHEFARRRASQIPGTRHHAFVLEHLDIFNKIEPTQLVRLFDPNLDNPANVR